MRKAFLSLSARVRLKGLCPRFFLRSFNGHILNALQGGISSRRLANTREVLKRKTKHNMHTTKSLCLHSTTHAVSMPRESRHYQRVECDLCGAFLKFLPKPENYERRIANIGKLTRLPGYVPGESYNFTPPERQFLDNLIILGGKFWPAQQRAFDGLVLLRKGGNVQ